MQSSGPSLVLVRLLVLFMFATAAMAWSIFGGYKEDPKYHCKDIKTLPGYPMHLPHPNGTMPDGLYVVNVNKEGNVQSVTFGPFETTNLPGVSTSTLAQRWAGQKHKVECHNGDLRHHEDADRVMKEVTHKCWKLNDNGVHGMVLAKKGDVKAFWCPRKIHAYCDERDAKYSWRMIKKDCGEYRTGIISSTDGFTSYGVVDATHDKFCKFRSE